MYNADIKNEVDNIHLVMTTLNLNVLRIVINFFKKHC